MKRPVISIIIISLAVILLAFFVILPEYKELNSKNFQVEEKRFEFETLEEYFRELSLKNEELEKYESKIAKIGSSLPDNPNIASVFYFIQKTAEENGIFLISTTLASSKKKSQTEKLEASEIKESKFSINVIGSYSSFKHFLSVLEKSARLIEVEEISFSSLKEMETTIETGNLFSFDLQMRVYSY